MKNWIIVALIFVIPLTTYAFLDMRAQNAAMVKNPKAKIIKFSSPMCSECKEAETELNKAMENYKDSVIIEEINVVENVGKGVNYNKNAIKKFNVKLVPTIVFLNKSGDTVKVREGAMKADEIIEVLDGIK